MCFNHDFWVLSFSRQIHIRGKLEGIYLRFFFCFKQVIKAIEIANAIFGFEGWSSSVVDVTPDFVPSFSRFSNFLKMDEMPGPRFRVGVTAVVKVSLKNGSYHEARQCCGFLLIF